MQVGGGRHDLLPLMCFHITSFLVPIVSNFYLHLKSGLRVKSLSHQMRDHFVFVSPLVVGHMLGLTGSNRAEPNRAQKLIN